MEFPVKTGAPDSQKTTCAILPIFEGRRLKGPTHEVDMSCGGTLSRLIKAGNVSAKPGETLLVPNLQGTATDRVLLVGCGKESKFNAKALHQAISTAANALRLTGTKEATSYLAYAPIKDLDEYYAARITVEATHSALYRFDELKSKSSSKVRLSRLPIAINDSKKAKDARLGVTHGRAISTGVGLARNLANRPANICTPSHLAEEARAIAKRYKNIRTKVLAEHDMKRLGMGAMLSVTHGAEEPARLIVLEYMGAGADIAPIAICGKGITFDTGGISLKPPSKMDEMKFDMCGAATAMGTMEVLGKLQPAINVVAVVPACENMPGSRATRPGDIVKTMSGQTVEILNTDAEGRLILCDALTYAARYKPRYLIDVATLTGACVVAVGHIYAGLFSNNEDLASDILAAGKRSLDPAWRLPVDEEYGVTLRSNFADFANSGGRDGGASTAAQFLSRFVEDTPWAHLDIAGVAWKSNRDKGATGRPVPLLTDFLLNL
jgi:leucyl aminopeptidase